MGQRVALTGSTGSGKSLLLRALAMLDPVDSGEVCWQGLPIAAAQVPGHRARSIYVMQRSTLVAGTVRESLREPFLLAIHQRNRYSEEKVAGLLESIDIGRSFLDKRTANLSGGEQQIAAAIRVIQLAPTVLLLDEPTSALDHVHTRRVEQLIFEWFDVNQSTAAYVWVTHDHQQAHRVGNRFWSMDGGKLTDRRTSTKHLV